jgi:hypothetical protein
MSHLRVTVVTWYHCRDMVSFWSGSSKFYWSLNFLSPPDEV